MKHSSQELPTKVYQGLLLFNQHFFYEAHEYFEDAWRETEDESREFFRVLLQMSGGFYRLKQRRPQAAKKFFTHALSWLNGFPNPYRGINTNNLKKMLQELINAIDSNQKSDTILQNHFKPLYPENEGGRV